MRVEQPQGVGKTALGVARMRARESRRDDRLFEDPFAQAFVDAAPGAFPEEPQTAEARAALGPLAALGAAFFAHTVIRTRFYDDYLTAAAAAGARQVVLLAAGLDTRAFRLAWPTGTRVFELDLPGVLGFKEQVLAGCGAVAGCERITVPCDLRGDWRGALAGAGFAAHMLATWLAEGLMIYLTGGEAQRLLGGITALSSPGSELAFEHNPAGRDTLTTRAARLPGMRPYASLWQGGFAGAPGWLDGHGWRTEFHRFATLAAGYGRQVPEPARSGFLTAVRTSPWPQGGTASVA